MNQQEPPYMQMAAMIREQIADGTLKPGDFAPSAAELRKATGHDVATCKRTIRELVMRGELVRWPHKNSRATVPGTTNNITNSQALSNELRIRRIKAGLIQAELAELMDVSVTTIAYAETCRLSQSRHFWEKADDVLNAQGALLALYETYKSNPEGPAVMDKDSSDKDSSGHSKIAEALRDAVKIVDETLPWQPGASDDLTELRKAALEMTFAQIMNSSDG
jgi:DNA-binding transcriptional regulator YhcF (GntR family)